MGSLERFGLDVGIYGPLAEPKRILALAERAESCGFGSIWVADHVAFPLATTSPYPYSATGDFPARLGDPLMEPIATLGVLVGVTRRVRIGTAVLVMPYRNPVLLARMLVTLDHFSGGRIVLGAGVGWLAEEFAALGAPDFQRRGRVTDEYLAIFKAIAAGGPVSYRGQSYAFDPIHSAPGAVQRPHPPILIGGISEAALRRVARHGDGWLAVSAGPARLRQCLARLARLAAEAGRRFEDLSLAYKLFLRLGEQRGEGAREIGSGSTAQVAGDVRLLTALGFRTIIVRFGAGNAAALGDEIDRFTHEIAPAASAAA
jgi:probable F420-dependent oxidoreductase